MFLILFLSSAVIILASSRGGANWMREREREKDTRQYTG